MSTVVKHTEQSATGGGGRLLAEFPYPSYEEWHEAAVALLKGIPFEKKMLTKTYEDITLNPIYRQEDGEKVPQHEVFPGFPPYLRGKTAAGHKTSSWDVAQEIPYSAPDEFNSAVRHDLKNGQTAVNLVLDAASQHGVDPDAAAQPQDVGRDGVSIATLEDFEQAFNGIETGEIPVTIEPGSAAISIAAFMATHYNTSLGKLRGNIGFDPLGMLATEGTLPYSLETAYRKMAALIHWANRESLSIQTVAVHSTPYHNSGGSASQELAFVLATAVEYLRNMQMYGLSVDETAPRFRLVFSVGSRYFMEIAKLRAARLLWAKMITAFDGQPASQNISIHVRSALWNKTLHDPYVNMLRTTVEAFAGIVGGCDSMHVSGFDEVVRTPGTFSRRIARNTQTILREEAHLNEVIDPAGGSWYIEDLTDKLARKAWELFQEIEKQGGMMKALRAGYPQEQIKQVVEKRKANLSTRKDVFVGTNMYPNLEETLLESPSIDRDALQQARAERVKHYRDTKSTSEKTAILEELSAVLKSRPTKLMETALKAVAAGATLGEIEEASTQKNATSPTIEALRIHRGAEIFEDLRAASDAYKAQTGSRPKIFMANMGPIPQHKARADFSAGFFQVGGFEMLSNDGFQSVDEAAVAALESGAAAVIICSTDATYPELVPPLTQKIKAAKPDTVVILAGYPKEHVEAFKDAGVDEFIHIKANAYDILVNLMKRIGINE